MTKRKTLQLTFKITSAFILIACIIFAILAVKSGLFKNIQLLQSTIAKTGAFSIFIFLGVQILQVVIPIIPGGVTLVAGVTLFGPWQGFLYNYLGIVLGSICAFLLSRYYGKPFIQLFVSEETYTKYEKWLEEKQRFHKLFATAMFLPGLPDDFICMLAGLTKMSLTKFTLILLLTKPVTLLVYSLGGISLNFFA